MIRPGQLRIAAAFAASALLHMLLLSVLALPQPARMRPGPLIVELTQAPEALPSVREPERLTQQSSVPAARPLGGQQRDRPPKDTAAAAGRGLVSASRVSAPSRAPESELADAASYLDEGQISAMPGIGAFRATYPRRALEERRRGPVVVQLMINADGSVAEAIALPGAQPDLAAAAVEALRYTRFIPARAGLLPARARVYYEVSFVIE